MIMPMPFYSAGRLEVTLGTVDITVAFDDSGGADQRGTNGSTFGAVANNSLINVDGENASIKLCVSYTFTSGGFPDNNLLRAEFTTQLKRDAAYNHIVTSSFTEFISSTGNFVIPTSTVSKNGNTLLDLFTDSPSAVWDAYIGNTYTMGWA